MTGRNALPRICIALGFSDVDELLAHAGQEVASGETFFEFRLDYLPQPMHGVAAIRKFLTQNPDCTILATCRRHQNHGRFNGSIEEQVAILEAAFQAGARAVDVEIESAEVALPLIEPLRARGLLIISFHNFSGTPAIDPIVRRMTKVPADAYKIVTTARKPSDNLRVLVAARTHSRTPLILLAMGEMGLPTRIVSPSMGGLYTYAAPNAAEGTAPGQLPARQLRSLYRFDKFTKAAKVYGVIASPVRHSISPAVHNRAFQARRIDAVYLPLLVQPAQLKDFFQFATNLPIAGFSVTIPHKQRIIRYLDVIDPLARRIGAVNTVWRKAGKWRGANTDVQGVIAPLKKRMTLMKSSVLIIGNGGAARSAAFALSDAGAKVSIVGRNPDRVRALAKACGALPLLREQLDSQRFDAVVHCTPIGMYPHVNECFFQDKIPADLVFDMVYNPLETQLIQRASSQGATTIAGLQMFLEQAAHQFEIWTGESAPRPVMEKAALEALAVHASNNHTPLETKS
ncbi:MAG: shikimate dehydrogenase [Bryobacterales bacterium]|nr:shikimate dehydrogenase [Bryobacterales bacterium]